jgi:predicted Zn-dependent protease
MARPARAIGRLAINLLLLAIFVAVIRWAPDSSGVPRSPGPKQVQKLQDEAAVMRRYNRWDKALAPTLKLHQSNPENHIYIAQLADIYGRLGRYREESPMWEEFLDRAPMPIEGLPANRAIVRKPEPVERSPALVRTLSRNRPRQSGFDVLPGSCARAARGY